MRIHLVTLRYAPSLGGFDDRPLADFVRDKDVLAVREHFFVVHDLPHLACLITYQDPVLPPPAAHATGGSAAPPSRNLPARNGPDPSEGLAADEQALYATVREWRSARARKEGVPPYVILTNRELVAVIKARPQTPNALASVPGIGAGKVERYGRELLERLNGAGGPAALTAGAALVAGAPVAAATTAPPAPPSATSPPPSPVRRADAVSAPADRPPAREAGPELLLLAKFEEFTGWLFDRTAKWPKSARFTLTQRIENHALDVVEELVVARYVRDGRRARLDGVNLRLERLRHLFRLARGAAVCPASTFETAVRSLDEAGRMLFGWRSRLSGGGAAPPASGGTSAPTDAASRGTGPP